MENLFTHKQIIIDDKIKIDFNDNDNENEEKKKNEEDEEDEEQENQNKNYIKESLEKELHEHFNLTCNNQCIIAHTLEKRISSKPCIMLCCFPFTIIFTIIFSPCLCFSYWQKINQKKEEENKSLDNEKKDFELRQTNKYQIEFMEKKIECEKKEIKNYKNKIDLCNKQIPKSIYKIELLEERLKYINIDK